MTFCAIWWPRCPYLQKFLCTPKSTSLSMFATIFTHIASNATPVLTEQWQLAVWLWSCLVFYLYTWVGAPPVDGKSRFIQVMVIFDGGAWLKLFKGTTTNQVPMWMVLLSMFDHMRKDCLSFHFLCKYFNALLCHLQVHTCVIIPNSTHNSCDCESTRNRYAKSKTF